MTGRAILDWDACLAKIQAEDVGNFFKTIELAFDMNPLEDLSKAPAVYLYAGYQDTMPPGSGASKQLFYHTLVCDLICRHEDLNQAVTIVRNALVGWEIDANHGPFAQAHTGYQQNQAAGPMDIKGGIIWWQDRLQCSTHGPRIFN